MAGEERAYVIHDLPSVELICAPFDNRPGKGHDWNGKSQKKIRRELRQKGIKKHGK